MAKGVEIKGHKSLINLLRELPKRAETKVNRRAVNLATTTIVQAVKSNAPEEEGDLKKAITKKVYNKGPRANGIVGADADYVREDGKKPANYDHLVEYGHEAADGTHVPANGFMRRGWDSSIESAQRKYEIELANGIEKEAAILGDK